MLEPVLLVYLVTNAVVGQIPQLTASELQQCAADLACAMDYSSIFQAKLDNVSNYMELELALLRHQTNNILVPLQSELDQLKVNHTHETSVLNKAVVRMELELSQDREHLNNLTSSLYTLNNNYHQENLQRYQDVHSLTQQLTKVQSEVSALTNVVNSLLAGSGNITLSSLPSIGSTSTVTEGDSCSGKDAELVELRNNLTYYINAFTSSQQALENVRALESFLQSQVIQLKANLTQAENVNRIKDNLIISLQTQLKLAQSKPSSLPSPDTCNSELGMRSGKIPPSAVTASAYQTGYEPTHARLDDSQGWYTPERSSSTDYLQVDTGSLHYITKVVTQGAPCCDVMVTNYTLQYSNDGSNWNEYRKDCQVQYLEGNTDETTPVEHTLDAPVLARYLRFNVIDFKKDGVSNYVGMRVELYGCNK